MGIFRKKPKKRKESTMPIDAIKKLLAAIKSGQFFTADNLTAAFTVAIWLFGLIKGEPSTPVPVTPDGGGADSPVLKLEAGMSDESAVQHFEAIVAAPGNALFNLPSGMLLNWLLKFIAAQIAKNLGT